MTRGRAALMALAGLALVGVVAGLDRPAAGRSHGPHGVRLPATDVGRVCPDFSGTDNAPTVVTAGLLSVPGSGRDLVTTAQDLAPHGNRSRLSVPPTARVESTHDRRALLVRSRGSAAAYVVADQSRLVSDGRGRGLLSAPCSVPGTDWWLVGADGRVGYSDTLVIANPGTTTANVTVTGWSLDGPLDVPRLQGLTIGAGRTARLPVSGFAPDHGLVTVHVHANTGAVAADVLDRRVSGLSAAGTDWIPPGQPPGPMQVVPGFPSGSGPRVLVVTNPGPVDATVKLHIVTASGSFAPAGHPSFVVRAHRSASVDLAQSLAGGSGAAVLRSDQPIVAAGYSKDVAPGPHTFADLQWQPAAAALTGPAGLVHNAAPLHGASHLLFTAPAGAATVRVTTPDGTHRVVGVPAGRTVRVDPDALLHLQGGVALRFDAVGGGPVYISRTLYAAGAHGPLLTAEEPSPFPPPVVLPAVVDDPRAAVP